MQQPPDEDCNEIDPVNEETEERGDNSEVLTPNLIFFQSPEVHANPLRLLYVNIGPEMIGFVKRTWKYLQISILLMT